MRICELNLLAFGPFTETAIDLTAGEAGLQIIYGPNESGKSTSLRAIQSVLFGFPHSSQDGFFHDKPKVAGVLQSAAGRELSFVRRKGRKNTLLHPVTEAAIAERELQAFLCGVDRQTFQDVFAIDHTRLVSGGEELRQLRGLVGESLYTAALGGGRLVSVMDQLTDEAQAIFDTRKKKCSIKDAEREFKQALQDKKEATIPFSRWEKLQKDLSQVTAARQKTLDHIRRLRTEEKRAERIRRSLGLLASRSRLLARIAQIGTVALLPESYLAEDRIRAEHELAGCKRRIEELQQQLVGDDGLRRQQALLQVPTELLDSEAEIRRLHERSCVHSKAMDDCSFELRPRLVQLRQQVARSFADLNTVKTFADIDQLRISPNRLLGIQNLASEEKQVRSEPGRISERRRELERTLDRRRSRLHDLGEPRDTTRLMIACDAVRKRGDVEGEKRELRAKLAELQAAAEKRLVTLGLWRGSLAEVCRLPVPLRETVERFDRDLMSLEQELHRLHEKDRELETELAQIHRKANAIEQAESVPTEADLTELREQRNQVWKTLRRALLGQGRKVPADPAQCESFERLILASDIAADRLRREAGRVQELAQLRARSEELSTRRQRLTADIQACEQRKAKHETAWQEPWGPCGIQPLSPREMLAWMSKFSELTRSAEEAAKAASRRDSLQAWMDEQAAQIRDCLGQLDQTVNESSLAVLVGQAEKRIDGEVERNREREQLREEIERLQDEVAQTMQAESQAEQVLKRWQEKWSVAMNELGCDAEATAEQANQRVAKLAEMFDHHDEAKTLKTRIADIERENLDFEQQVADVVTRVADDLKDRPASAVTGMLQKRLESAKQAENDRIRLVAEIKRAESELEDARRKQQSLQATLARYCELAGVGSVELLPDVEQSSSEIRECRQKLDEVEQQLEDLGAGIPIESMVEDAAEQDVDRLDARLAELATEIESLERARDEQMARQSELQSQCDAADGRASAAEADGRALGILSRMHDAAARFLKLRLAAVLLRQQIERHRSENEDPILAKASDYFARITCNEFRGLQTEYDADEAVIVARRHSGATVDVQAMSTGTRDQLYLALRLAYLEKRLEQHEPLPFIVDDVLVHFDDERAAATLHVLAELSRQTQVILFTHHQRILDLLELRLDKGTYFAHQLNHHALLQTR